MIDGLTDDDDLFGGAGDDKIEGRGGQDFIQGNAGDDILRGGITQAPDDFIVIENGGVVDTDADTILGGADDDIFIAGINTIAGGTDAPVITDFNPDEDAIVISFIDENGEPEITFDTDEGNFVVLADDTIVLVIEDNGAGTTLGDIQAQLIVAPIDPA